MMRITRRDVLRVAGVLSLTTSLPSQVHAGSDVDEIKEASFPPVIAGENPPAASGTGFIILRATVTRRARDARSAAIVTFRSVAGRGTIRVNGVEVARKTNALPAAVELRVPAGTDALELLVILETTGDMPVGLPGSVFVEAVGP